MLHKVINVKHAHKINVIEKCVHKVKRHSNQLKVNGSNKKTLKIFSTNGAGIVNGKIDSLKHEVKAVGATVVTVQETHCRKEEYKWRARWCLKPFEIRKVEAQSVQFTRI